MRGLAYWLGSQHTLAMDSRVNEGAIAQSLSKLLFVHRDDGRHIETEVLYRHVPELNRGNELDRSQERADLVLANCRRLDRRQPYGAGEVEAIIEIKHFRSPEALMWKDIDYLGEQRRKCNKLRTFLVYASVDKTATVVPY